jgi:hypothetical protein
LSCRDEAVRVVPERVAPQVGFEVIFVLVANASSSCTFDGVDELHEVCGWLGPEQDVNVVVFAVEIGQCDTILVFEPLDDPANELGSLLGEYTTPILGGEYQVVVE